MLVDLLYFAGCPNHEPVRELVERLAHELRVQPELRLVEVPDLEAAERMRFLGSPTVRVNGRDVEPGADARDDFTLGCRVFKTPSGLRGQPDEAWVREALSAAIQLRHAPVVADSPQWPPT